MGVLISAVSGGALSRRNSSIGLPGPTTARMILSRRRSIAPTRPKPRNGCLSGAELKFQAQDEFGYRTGGGIGGAQWVAPLLPKDFKPPVDLRWPEYLQTSRGEEWWIPTPAIGSGAGETL